MLHILAVVAVAVLIVFSRAGFGAELSCASASQAVVTGPTALAE
jgi:hypothetical protein